MEVGLLVPAPLEASTAELLEHQEAPCLAELVDLEAPAMVVDL